jgi:hypothetical protein
VGEQPAHGLARLALDNPAFHWLTTETEHAEVHVEVGSFAAGRMAELEKRVESARAHDLEMLGEREFEPRIHVFYVESRERMKRLVGYPVTGWTEAESGTTVLVASEDWSPFERHEIMHVLSLTVWGPPREPGDWLQEGIGAAAEDRCGAYAGRQFAAGLARRGEIIPLSTLISAFRREDDLVAYLEAGSLVTYLLETYGLASLWKLWHDGAGAAPAAFGKPLEEIELDWRRWLDLTPDPAPDVDLERISDKGCG